MRRQDGTLLLVASTGGHLAQLHDIAGRIPHCGGRLWVTFDRTQSRTLLAGESVAYIPYIAERDAAGVARAFFHARRLLAASAPVRAVVSTGSAIALAFLPYGASRGIPVHYIESAARTGKISLSGRLLSAIPGVHLYRQYAQAASGRWRYGGSVFDGFQPLEVNPRPVQRIVVTLGATARFRRLLERLVAIIPPGVGVLWQTADTPVDGLGIDAQPFVSAAALSDAMRDADVVVAHAGCGSALAALKAGKRPVLIPREPGEDDVIDAHQQEIATWLEARGLALSRPLCSLCFTDLEQASAWMVAQPSQIPAFHL
jgi:UDP-N-acetylglucosamine transferase subunit ALG13